MEEVFDEICFPRSSKSPLTKILQWLKMGYIVHLHINDTNSSVWYNPNTKNLHRIYFKINMISSPEVRECLISGDWQYFFEISGNVKFEGAESDFKRIIRYSI